MKTSNKILIVALGLPCLFAAGVVLRLGVFAFYEQPDRVFFSQLRGESVTRTLPYDAFDALEIQGFWKIAVARGPRPTVTVRADEETHRRLATEFADGTLKIHQTYFSLHESGQPELTIVMPRLRSLRVRGGNEIGIAGFEEARTAIDVRGLVDFEGRACRITTARLSGVGLLGVDLSACKIENAELDYRGLGEVLLHMTGGRLTGRVSPEINVEHEGAVRGNDLKAYESLDQRWEPDEGADSQ